MNNDFVHLFSHAAGEFADEECWYLVERIAIHEGKTHQQVSMELKDHWEGRKVPGQHPFQTWGLRELLNRIKASQHIEVD